MPHDLDPPKWSERIAQLDDLKPYGRNPRIITKESYERLKSAIKDLGFHQRMLCQPDLRIIGGHQRLKALRELGFKEVQVLVPDRELTLAEFRRLLIQDNLPFGQHDFNILSADFDMDELLEWGMPKSWFDGPAEKPPTPEAAIGSLSEKFGVPPFSVLDARAGWWQERKRGWLALGIKSEEGRNAPAGGSPDLAARQGGESGTSIFDPVLTELAVRWFSPPGGCVLDPFAGGSVRGLVAGRLGRFYFGCDLRAEQVVANLAQLPIIGKEGVNPQWKQGDSQDITGIYPEVQADFVFSCPPYADLEVYSDDPRDLSNMNYSSFREAYATIIRKTCSMLKNDRFAAFVVGEVRDTKGNFYDFVGDTVRAFKSAGLNFYNEAILVTPTGAVALRAGKTFSSSRKLGMCHQHVLVFIKGDPKKAAQACGEVEVDEAMFSVPAPQDGAAA